MYPDLTHFKNVIVVKIHVHKNTKTKSIDMIYLIWRHLFITLCDLTINL